MYSVVMMMALTTGVDLPDARRGGGCGCEGGGQRHHGRRHRGHGGGGCGGYVSSCGHGGECGYGGGCGFGGGSPVAYSGGGFGGCGPMVYGGGGFGGYPMGGYPGGAVYPAAPTYGAPYGPGAPTGPAPEGIRKMPRPKDRDRDRDGDKTEAEPNAAVIVVSLPEDATLTVDGAPTTSASAVRVLVSPELNPDREYHYTLQAEVVRDGQPVRIEQRVAVRAGEETQVTLPLPTGVAQR